MFKNTISSEILIHADARKVWDILLDFQKYPTWNTFITEVKGNTKIGAKLFVRIEPPAGKGQNFYPRVLNIENAKELRWLGHFIIPGLFDGEHIFQLTDNKNGTTTFIQSEKFKGFLVLLFKKVIDINTHRGFEVMNMELKKEAEKQYL